MCNLYILFHGTFFHLLRLLIEEYPSSEKKYFPLEHDFRKMLNVGINDLPIVTHCMSFIL
jgi:hypothetical protein